MFTILEIHWVIIVLVRNKLIIITLFKIHYLMIRFYFGTNLKYNTGIKIRLEIFSQEY